MMFKLIILVFINWSLIIYDLYMPIIVQNIDMDIHPTFLVSTFCPNQHS
jgi:hypothetical protein